LWKKVNKVFRPIAIVAGCLLLGYLVWRMGPGKLVHTILLIPPFFVIGAVVLWGINLALGTLRFRRFSRIDVSYSEAAEIYLTAFLLNYASMIQGVGVGAKISLLGEKNVAVPQSIATVILEVLFDVLFTGAITGIYLSKDVLKLGMSYQFGVTIVFFALVIAGSPIVLRRYPWWSEFVMVLSRSIGSYRGIFNLLITMGIWFTAGVSLSILLSGFGVEFGISNIWRAIQALATGFIFGLITLIPGGLGVRDVTWALVLESGGVTATVAGTAVLMMRVISIATVIVILLGLRCSSCRKGNDKGISS
jgi:uncharacterized membrane protein YbhN (UPF0104 family)